MNDNDPLPGPRLDAAVKDITYDEGKITSLVLVNEADGEQWRIEGEMEVVDPYDSGEPIPDGGGIVGGDKPDDWTPPRQREHYWVECRYCGEETYDLERRCIHCGSDRQAHREPEHRDPDRRRMPDGGEPGGTVEVEATLKIGVMATVPTHATRDETEQALYENLEDGRLDGVYIYDGPHADSSAKFEQWLDDNAPRTDGGVTVERDEPDLPEVIGAVLGDAAGGLDRQVLVERVAELSGATLDEAEEALGGEIRHGRAIVVDGEVRKTPNRRFAGRSR